MPWTQVPLPQRGVSSQNPKALPLDQAAHLSGIALDGNWMHLRTRVQAASTLSPSGAVQNAAVGVINGTTVGLLLTKTTAYTYNAGAWSATAESYTTDDNLYSSCNPPGYVVFTRPQLNLRTYNGSAFGALVAVGTNHSAYSVASFADRIISAHTFEAGTEYPTRIRWSSATITDWNATGSGTAEITSVENNMLTAVVNQGDRCFLTKPNMIYELIRTGDASVPFTTQPRVIGIGLPQTRQLTWKSVGEFSFFSSFSGIQRFDGNRVESIDQDLRHIMVRNFNSSTNDPFALYTRQALLEGSLGYLMAEVDILNKEYWLLAPNVTDSNTITCYIFDYKSERWFEHMTRARLLYADPANRFRVSEYNGNDNKSYTYGLKTVISAGYDYEFTPTYVTRALPALRETRQGQSLAPQGKNVLKTVTLQGQANMAVTVNAYADEATSATDTKAITLGADGYGEAHFAGVPYRTIRIEVKPTSTPNTAVFLTDGLYYQWEPVGVHA